MQTLTIDERNTTTLSRSGNGREGRSRTVVANSDDKARATPFDMRLFVTQTMEERQQDKAEGWVAQMIKKGRGTNRK